MLKTVSEITAKLADRGYCEPHVEKVNKGTAANPRELDIVTWHEAVRMLDEVFGPFGYDLEIANSTTDYTNGIYTVDMTLTGRGLNDATGEVVTLKRAGRGLGLVPRSAIESDAEHDRQAHGAKSDAITNATKSLGDGFGLYLYRKSPSGQSYAAGGYGARASQTGGTASGAASGAANGTGGGARRGPSEKQMGVLTKNGYTHEQVAGMEFRTWKGVIDAIFSGGQPPVAPASQPQGRQGAAAGGVNERIPVSVGAAGYAGGAGGAGEEDIAF